MLVGNRTVARLCNQIEKMSFSNCSESLGQGTCVASGPNSTLSCWCISGYSGRNCDTYNFLNEANLKLLIVLAVFLVTIVIMLMAACVYCCKDSTELTEFEELEQEEEFPKPAPRNVLLNSRT